MIIRFEDLKGIREKHGKQKIVLGGGSFDILHQGHIDYLRDIKALGDVLVIAVKSDVEVRSYKEVGRPIQEEDVRAAIVDAIRYVDYTIIAPEGSEGDPTPPRLRVAEELRPDILVSPSPKWHGHEATLKELGVELKVVPIEKVNSTTSIIERIRNRPNA